jgi:hypothetical protein
MKLDPVMSYLKPVSDLLSINCTVLFKQPLPCSYRGKSLGFKYGDRRSHAVDRS